MSLNIGVSQTVCFRLQDEGSIRPKYSKFTKNNESEPQRLHTLTLTEIEQYHAITERYRFAIPELETNCICECNSEASTCQADEYKYGKCQEGNLTTMSVCYRTFFPNQPVGSCDPKSSLDSTNNIKSSRLCCQLRFQAFQNRRFTAVKLKASTTYAVLRYSVYEWLNREQQSNSSTLNLTSKWIEYEQRRIRVQLDGSVHNSVLNELSGLKLSIIGLSTGKFGSENQLEAGMYFVEEFPNGEYGQLISQSLNQITEHE